MSNKYKAPEDERQWKAKAKAALKALYGKNELENAEARYNELRQTLSDRAARAQLKKEGLQGAYNRSKKAKRDAEMADLSEEESSNDMVDDNSDEESDNSSDENSDEMADDDNDNGTSADDDSGDYTSQDDESSADTEPMEEAEQIPEMPHNPVILNPGDLAAIGAAHLEEDPVSPRKREPLQRHRERKPLDRRPTVELPPDFFDRTPTVVLPPEAFAPEDPNDRLMPDPNFPHHAFPQLTEDDMQAIGADPALARAQFKRAPIPRSNTVVLDDPRPNRKPLQRTATTVVNNPGPLQPLPVNSSRPKREPLQRTKTVVLEEDDDESSGPPRRRKKLVKRRRTLALDDAPEPKRSYNDPELWMYRPGEAIVPDTADESLADVRARLRKTKSSAPGYVPLPPGHVPQPSGPAFRDPAMQDAPHTPIAVTAEDLAQAGAPDPLAAVIVEPSATEQDRMNHDAAKREEDIAVQMLRSRLATVKKRFPHFSEKTLMKAYDQEKGQFDYPALRFKTMALRAQEQAAQTKSKKQPPKRGKVARGTIVAKDPPSFSGDYSELRPEPMVQEVPDPGTDIVVLPRRQIPPVEPRATDFSREYVPPDAPRPRPPVERSAAPQPTAATPPEAAPRPEPRDPKKPSTTYTKKRVHVRLGNQDFVIPGEALISFWNPDSDPDSLSIFPDMRTQAFRKLFTEMLWTYKEFDKWKRLLTAVFRERARTESRKFYTDLLNLAKGLVKFTKDKNDEYLLLREEEEEGTDAHNDLNNWYRFFNDRYAVFSPLIPALEVAVKKHSAAGASQKKPRAAAPKAAAPPDAEMIDSEDDRDEPRISLTLGWKREKVTMLLASFMFCWNPQVNASNRRYFTTEDSRRLRQQVGDLFWDKVNETHFGQYKDMFAELFFQSHRRTVYHNCKNLVEAMMKLGEKIQDQYQKYRDLIGSNPNPEPYLVEGVEYWAARGDFLFPLLQQFAQYLKDNYTIAGPAPPTVRSPDVVVDDSPGVVVVDDSPPRPATPREEKEEPPIVAGPDGSVDSHPPVNIKLYYSLWDDPYYPISPDTPAWYESLWRDVQEWKKTHPRETALVNQAFTMLKDKVPLDHTRHAHLIEVLVELFTSLDNTLIARRNAAEHYARQLAAKQQRDLELAKGGAYVKGALEAQQREQAAIHDARVKAYHAEQHVLAVNRFLAGVLDSGVISSGPVFNTQINVDARGQYHVPDPPVVPIPMEVDEVEVAVVGGTVTPEVAGTVVEEAVAAAEDVKAVIEEKKDEARVLIAEKRDKQSQIRDLDKDIDNCRKEIERLERQLRSRTIEGSEEEQRVEDELAGFERVLTKKLAERKALEMEIIRDIDPELASLIRETDALDKVNEALERDVSKLRKELAEIDAEEAKRAPKAEYKGGVGASAKRAATIARRTAHFEKRRAMSAGAVHSDVKKVKRMLSEVRDGPAPAREDLVPPVAREEPALPVREEDSSGDEVIIADRVPVLPRGPLIGVVLPPLPEDSFSDSTVEAASSSVDEIPVPPDAVPVLPRGPLIGVVPALPEDPFSDSDSGTGTSEIEDPVALPPPGPPAPPAAVAEVDDGSASSADGSASSADGSASSADASASSADGSASSADASASSADASASSVDSSSESDSEPAAAPAPVEAPAPDPAPDPAPAPVAAPAPAPVAAPALDLAAAVAAAVDAAAARVAAAHAAPSSEDSSEGVRLVRPRMVDSSEEDVPPAPRERRPDLSAARDDDTSMDDSGVFMSIEEHEPSMDDSPESNRHKKAETSEESESEQPVFKFKAFKDRKKYRPTTAPVFETDYKPKGPFDTLYWYDKRMFDEELAEWQAWEAKRYAAWLKWKARLDKEDPEIDRKDLHPLERDDVSDISDDRSWAPTLGDYFGDDYMDESESVGPEESSVMSEDEPLPHAATVPAPAHTPHPAGILRPVVPPKPAPAVPPKPAPAVPPKPPKPAPAVPPKPAPAVPPKPPKPAPAVPPKPPKPAPAVPPKPVPVVSSSPAPVPAVVVAVPPVPSAPDPTVYKPHKKCRKHPECKDHKHHHTECCLKHPKCTDHPRDHADCCKRHPFCKYHKQHHNHCYKKNKKKQHDHGDWGLATPDPMTDSSGDEEEDNNSSDDDIGEYF
jgi:hypothetical protein